MERIGDAIDQVIVVGGQAVNYWAERYAPRNAALEANAPYTSKDLDFAGDRRVVRTIAERLGGTSRLPDMDDHTVSSGLILFTDRGVERQIDFIDKPAGIELDDLKKMRIPIRVPTDGTTLKFYVMNPLLCLESRIHNCLDLEGYQNEHAVAQARAAVEIAREYIVDTLGRPDDGKPRARPALKAAERIFRFSREKSRRARMLARFDVDCLKAIPRDSRLPERFLTQRLPQMEEILDRQRKAKDERPSAC